MATSATEAKIDTAKAEAAAEKAYAAAAAQVETKAEAKPAPVAVSAPVSKAAAKAPAAPKAVKAKAAAKKAAKPVVAKKAVKATAKPATAKPATAKPATAKPAAAKTPAISQFKDTIMTKTKATTEDFTAKVQEAVTEAQSRAKLAFEKGQALFGEAGEFTKGNVEALVESGKILAAGLQDIGKDYVAEGKTALETVQADFKQLAAVKSPTDFFKLQGEIMRRNFDAAVATGSKHSEKAVKLANDAFAPISNRVSLAVEKVKQAA